MQMCHLC